MGVQRNKTVHF